MGSKSVFYFILFLFIMIGNFGGKNQPANEKKKKKKEKK